MVNGIERLARDLKLAQLRLTIGFFMNVWISRKQSNTDMWGDYQRILQSLDKLKGLKDLFIHLRIDPELHYAKRIRGEREEQLERRVMGEGYVSGSRTLRNLCRRAEQD
jgi:hypothetical protein